MPNKEGQLTRRERIILDLLKVHTPVNRRQRRQVAKAVRQATKYCLRSDAKAKTPGRAYARIAAALLPHAALDQEKVDNLKRADAMLRAALPKPDMTEDELRRALDPRVEKSEVDAVGVLPALRPDSPQEPSEQVVGGAKVPRPRVRDMGGSGA